MGAPKEQTVTSKSEPWEEAKPYYEDLYSKAQEAFAETNKDVYTGELTAAPSETSKAATTALAGNQWGAYAPTVNAMGADLASGKYLDPNSNPWLKASVDAALSDVTKKYTEEVFPSIGSSAIQAGAYGGGRQGVLEGLAAGEFSREANEAATNIYASNYQAERDRMLTAADQFAKANELEMSQLQGQAGAGEQETEWTQAELDEAYQKWQMEQAAPWTGFPELLSILTGGGFESTATTGPNPSYTDPLQMLMGLGSLGTGLLDVFQPAEGYSWI